MKIELKDLDVSKKPKYIYEYDKKDKDEIVSEYLIPFWKNENFIFNGYNLNNQKINQFYITETEESSSKLLEKAYKNLDENIMMVIRPVDVVFDRIYDITSIMHQEAKRLIGNERKDNIMNPEEENNLLLQHIHPLIDKSSYKKYIDGHYADSVESAFKEINQIQQRQDFNQC
jgi:hypothetical protein